MRIGIIGAGGQAMAHGAALQVVDGMDLAAMAGRGRKSLKRAAGEVGASAAESPEALIADATIDGVIIACPTAHHRDYAVAALEAGKHVFCEFPLAPSLADADAMIAAARQAGRVLMAGQLLRHVAAFSRLRNILSDGKLGKVVAVSTTRLGPPYWPEGESLATVHHGDVIQEMLSFDVDILNWMFGMPDKVWGAGAASQGAFDHVHAGLRYGDVIVAAEASVLLPRGSTFATTLRATCENGMVELDFLLPPGGPVEMWFAQTRSGGKQSAIQVEGIDPDVAQMRAFKRAVEAGPKGDEVLAESARDTLDICLQIDAVLR
jgi:predicted dehydrogenase